MLSEDDSEKDDDESSSSDVSSSYSESDIKETCQIENTKGLSDESLLLLKEIRNQRMLFEDRIDNRQTGKSFLIRFITIMNVNKIRFKRVPARDINYRKSKLAYFGEIRNLANCFKEIRELEDSYGQDLWVLHFIIMHNLLVDMEEILARVLFRSSIIDIYLKCVKAINERQWHLIAKHISDIQFIFNTRLPIDKYKTMPTSKLLSFSTKIRYRSEPVTFYLTSLFLAAAQRNLQIEEDPELIMTLIDDTVDSFCSTCRHRISLWSNPSSFFILNGLVFKLCHGFYNSLMQSIDTPLIQVEPNWQRALYVYRMVAEYEIFCSNKDLQKADLFMNSIEGQFESLAHKEHTLILLPILIELCVYLGEGELLFEKLIDLCVDCPALFAHVCQILIANGCKDAPLSLFESLINTKADKIAFSSVTTDLLKEYSKEPAKYGPVTEVVKNNLQVAFSVLDYGRNRYNLDAWQTLHDNLKRVESEPAIISLFWTNRKSWWPRFHSLEKDTTECRKIKKKCFKRLKDIS